MKVCVRAICIFCRWPTINSMRLTMTVSVFVTYLSIPYLNAMCEVSWIHVPKCHQRPLWGTIFLHVFYSQHNNAVLTMKMISPYLQSCNPLNNCNTIELVPTTIVSHQHHSITILVVVIDRPLIGIKASFHYMYAPSSKD